MADLLSLDVTEIKKDGIFASRECYQRGLVQSGKWAAELVFALDQVTIPDVLELSQQSQGLTAKDFDCFNLAKGYFDCKEYDRAAHFVEGCTSAKAYFLHVYAKYLAAEKRRLDNVSGPQETGDHAELVILKEELHRKYKAAELDGFGLYLYGVVLRKLSLLQKAVDIFVESVNVQPLHWGAWLELALLCTDREMLTSLLVPDHWMKQFFLAHVNLELQLNEEALKIYQGLSEAGLGKSTYVTAQIAVAFHNLRDVDKAVETFGKIQTVDPYRLDNMDTYSNLLYVKEMRAELAQLAHQCCDIDKYREETCCVIGNYYGLRSQHEKAVLYFQRALKLNPNYLSAWTLMGHEYVELKNTHAAIQAYRKAVDVNRRDYRAWYGLGQAYELLKMPFYSLYYYRQAQMLRPNDSRMFVALGETYEKLERLQEAKKCFWKAHSIGDVEGIALIKLARLFERLDEKDQAAAAYTEFINDSENRGLYNPEDISQAYRFLANYYILNKQLDDAYAAAQKCTEFAETREEGKALLREIFRLRNVTGSGDPPQPLDDRRGSITSDSEQTQSREGTPINKLAPMNLTFTP